MSTHVPRPAYAGGRRDETDAPAAGAKSTVDSTAARKRRAPTAIRVPDPGAGVRLAASNRGLHDEEVTVDSTLRYFGSAVGFGFGALWMTAGVGAAIAAVLLAGLGYGVVFMAERAKANASTFDYEPLDDATSPLAAESEYGWPGYDRVEEPAAR
jgi:hypothetical protein